VSTEIKGTKLRPQRLTRNPGGAGGSGGGARAGGQQDGVAPFGELAAHLAADAAVASEMMLISSIVYRICRQKAEGQVPA
jgi:hypothetical protein